MLTDEQIARVRAAVKEQLTEMAGSEATAQQVDAAIHEAGLHAIHEDLFE
ncbi:MAG TPA: hypothetical protein VFA60_01085 [Terriglobales bacterium]|nr:hypothetical protein [Terriglobales bacterium]